MEDQYEEKSSTESLGSMRMSVAEPLTPTLSPNCTTNDDGEDDDGEDDDGEDDEIEELIDLDEANVISLPNWDRTETSRHSGLHNALNHFLRPEVPLSSDNSCSWGTQQDQTLDFVPLNQWQLMKQSSGTIPHPHLTLQTTARNEGGEARFFLLRLGSSIDPATTSQRSANTDLSTVDTSLAQQEHDTSGNQLVLLNIGALIGHQPSKDLLSRMDPAAHKLLSVFQTKSDALKLKLHKGQRTTDSRSWQAGFDTRIFSLSARKFPEKTPIYCPYKLQSSFGDYESFTQYNSQWNRRRQALEQIEGALDRRNYAAPQARDFSKLAKIFFSGLEVPENIDDDIREVDQAASVLLTLVDSGEEKDDQKEVNTSGQQPRVSRTQDQEIIPDIQIRFSTGTWTKVLGENPIHDKDLVCFLQDCAMANMFEEACRARKPLPGGVKVWRSSRWTDIRESSLLEPYSSSGDCDKVSEKGKGPAVGGNDHVTATETVPQRNEALDMDWVEDSDTAKAKRKSKRSKKRNNKHIPKRQTTAHLDDVSAEEETNDDISNTREEKKVPQLDVVAAKEKTNDDIADTPEDSLFILESTPSSDNGTQHSNKQAGQHKEVSDDTNEDDAAKEITKSPEQPLLEETPLMQPVKVISPVYNSHLGTDDSPNAFEPHDHLITKNSDAVGEAQWETVTSKSSKQRLSSRQGAALRSTLGGRSQHTSKGTSATEAKLVEAPPISQKSSQNPSSSSPKQLPTESKGSNSTGLVSRGQSSGSASSKNLKSHQRFGPPAKAVTGEDFPALSSSSTAHPERDTDKHQTKGEKRSKKQSTRNSPVTMNSNPNISPARKDALNLHDQRSHSALLDTKEAENKPSDTFITNGKHQTMSLDDMDIHVKATSSMPGNEKIAPTNNAQQKAFDTPVHSPKVDSEVQGSTVLTSEENRHHNLGHEVVRIGTNDPGTDAKLDVKDVGSVEDVGVDTDPQRSLTIDGHSDVTNLARNANNKPVQSGWRSSTISSTRNDGSTHADPGDVNLKPSASGTTDQVKNVTTSDYTSSATSEDHFPAEHTVGIRTPQSESNQHLLQIPLDHSTLPLAQNVQFDNSHHLLRPTNTAQHSDPLVKSNSSTIANVHNMTNTQNGTVPHLAVEPTNVADNQGAPSRTPVLQESFSSSHSPVQDRSVVSTLESSESNHPLKYQTPPKRAPTSYICSLCHATCFATLSTPLVLCPGCGPLSKIRYCSVGCLLANAYDHTYHCMNFPASQRLAFHNLPPSFVYVKDPIMAIDPWTVISAELFRQKAFSMYKRFDLSPTTFELERGREDPNKHITSNRKVSGDYHVFRSATTADEPLGNCKSDIIFTVSSPSQALPKGVLQRSLNACYLLPQNKILDYIFRVIRSYILVDEVFDTFTHAAPNDVVYDEFKQQFSKEFDFDPTPFELESERFDGETALRTTILPLLRLLEMRYPILQYWATI